MIRLRTVATGVAGSPWYINTHWEADTSVDAQTAADRMIAFLTALKGGFCNLVTFQNEATVVSIAPETGLPVGSFQIDNIPTVKGSGDSTMVGGGAQGLVRLATEAYVLGRNTKGRIFVPGLYAGAASTGGVMAGALRSQMQTAATGLIAATGPRLVVYSKPTDSVPGRTARVSGVSVWEQFAVLRSRRD